MMRCPTRVPMEILMVQIMQSLMQVLVIEKVLTVDKMWCPMLVPMMKSVLIAMMMMVPMVPMKVSLVSIKHQMKLHLTQSLPWLTAF